MYNDSARIDTEMSSHIHDTGAEYLANLFCNKSGDLGQNLSLWNCDPAQYLMSDNLFYLIKVLWLKHFEHQFSNPDETATMESYFIIFKNGFEWMEIGQESIVD